MPSESGVYKALVRAGLIEPGGRRLAEHWRRWERGTPNELWQMDVVGAFPKQPRQLGLDGHNSAVAFGAVLELAPVASAPVIGPLATSIGRRAPQAYFAPLAVILRSLPNLRR